MSKIITFMTKSSQINSKSFYPRKYNPIFLKTDNLLKKCEYLKKYISEDIKSGSTPPAEMFLEESEKTNYFIKTSAIERHIINVNDLYSINSEYHRNKLKRSITKPYEIIYSMTGKYMGKAAMCPKTVKEINMSQNSVRITTNNKRNNAFIEIYLNSILNRTQIKGLYSITKQKYINQNKIASLKVPEYNDSYNTLIDKYLLAFDNYYESLNVIKDVIKEFNDLIINNTKNIYTFKIQSKDINKILFTPSFYSNIMLEKEKINYKYFNLKDNIEENRWFTGKDVGSNNYEDDGIPFIKTSDIVNFDVDYHPDCYCKEIAFKSILKKGDIIFTKDGKIGEVAIIGQNVKIMPAGGIVAFHPQNDQERYGIFLVLSSKYGKMMFEKWSVIASTMTHLRKDNFLEDLKILNYNNENIKMLINKLKKAFEDRDDSFEIIEKISNEVCEKIIKQI